MDAANAASSTPVPTIKTAVIIATEIAAPLALRIASARRRRSLTTANVASRRLARSDRAMLRPSAAASGRTLVISALAIDSDQAATDRGSKGCGPRGERRSRLHPCLEIEPESARDVVGVDVERGAREPAASQCGQ